MTDEGASLGVPARVVYARPPIVEAVCDFRFIGSELWDPTFTGLLYNKLKGKYSKRRTVPHLQASVSVGSAGFESQFRPEVRTQFLSRDGKSVVSVAPDQVTASRLPPYQGWPRFKPMIEQVLDAYLEVARPLGYARIGLRYINRFSIPGKEFVLADYLDLLPLIGPRLPDVYGDFAVMVLFGFAEGRDLLRAQAHNLNRDQERPADSLPLDLDFDYHLAAPEAIPLGDAKEWVEQAHGQIVQAFEASIKDSLRELFGQKGGR